MNRSNIATLNLCITLFISNFFILITLQKGAVYDKRDEKVTLKKIEDIHKIFI